MSIWRKLVIFTLILAMPMSSWAAAVSNSHCQASDNNSHTMIVQVDDSDTINSHDHIASNDTSQSSCGGCDENMNCSVSICSAHVMFDRDAIASVDSHHFYYQRIPSFAYPVDPTLPYRPPIAFS